MLLGGMKWVCAIGYIDDIIVYNDTWEDHLRHLRQLCVQISARSGRIKLSIWDILYLATDSARAGIGSRPS